MMMEAVQTSETLANSYQSSRCYNPEDSHLHTHHHENLKSCPRTVYIGRQNNLILSNAKTHRDTIIKNSSRSQAYKKKDINYSPMSNIPIPQFLYLV
jgi:hypothetical protein